MYRFLSIFLLLGSLMSCSKHDDIMLYSSYYHQGADKVYSAIHIPNSFTPDGDGMNDMFYSSMNGISSFSLRIYNRTQQVFETANFNESWNGISSRTGLLAPSGIYSYILNAIDYTGHIYEIEGSVNLFR